MESIWKSDHPEWRKDLIGLGCVAICRVLDDTFALLKQGHDSNVLSNVEDLETICWEHLHLGDWQLAPLCFRGVYGIACIMHAKLALGRGDAELAQRKLDLALLMGHSSVHPQAHAMIKASRCKLKPPPQDFAWPDVVIPSPSFIKWMRPIEPKHDLIKALPSLYDFESQYIKCNQWCILRKLAQAWPCVSRWKDLNYLMLLMHLRLVPIELGSDYMNDAHWSQTLMTANDFVRDYICNTKQAVKGYLAQTELCNQIPDLLRDFLIPDYCAMGRMNDQQVKINFWMGPHGTVSPLHYDADKHNILTQVYGHKFVLLIPSDVCNASMYPHSGKMRNTSKIDLEANDWRQQFPKFCQHALPFARFCVLRAGDALYIPPNTWHFVKSLSPSISISFWWT